MQILRVGCRIETPEAVGLKRIGGTCRKNAPHNGHRGSALHIGLDAIGRYIPFRGRFRAKGV